MFDLAVTLTLTLDLQSLLSLSVASTTSSASLVKFRSLVPTGRTRGHTHALAVGQPAKHNRSDAATGGRQRRINDTRQSTVTTNIYINKQVFYFTTRNRYIMQI